MINSTEQALNMTAALFVDPDVPRATGDERWESIVEKVKKHDDHTVLVVDDSNKLIGLISNQDILNALSTGDKQLAAKVRNGEATARDIMTKIEPGKVDTVAYSSDTVQVVIDRLTGKNKEKRVFRAVPVVNSDGTVVGQVTRSSIQKQLSKLLDS